ncbi:hypothetical protein GDO86_019712 [Hymenochirus boettgeri]|uniref:Olfactory receptor n=1 Tax=Hymenochirus boettgeri TaxID=247094 RepID=A0A8T2IFY1_9PIPI|nr:hypothetical protein GDO86_019712 [Hymenochirus boettgeri]
MCGEGRISTNTNNQTKIKEFVLLGIEGPQTLKLSLFFVFLILYIMTTCGNLVIIVLYLQTQPLRSPLYFFLSNLALSDILLATSVVPNLLCTLSSGRETIMSTSGCIIQVLASGSSTAAESNLLTVMSYDRYLAVCNPLHYNRVMTPRRCSFLVSLCWFLSLLYTFIAIMEILDLEFCGCNVINYTYCDIIPLLDISCKNSQILEISTTVISFPAVVFPFCFTILSYINISLAVFRISSNTGRKKAFSTCSSHLGVVCTYFGVLIAKYTVSSKGRSVTINKAISMVYTVVTPLLNPIIYSFRNQEIKGAVTKWICVNLNLYT